MQQDANHAAEEKSTSWFSRCLRLATALIAADGLTGIVLPHFFISGAATASSAY
jgi:hypothetical protein